MWNNYLLTDHKSQTCECDEYFALHSFFFLLLVIKIQGHMLLSVYNLVARKRCFTVNVKHYHIKSHVGC